MLNPNCHLVGDMARLHREEMMRHSAERERRQMLSPDNGNRWQAVRTALGDWLISSGQRLKPEPHTFTGREAHQS